MQCDKLRALNATSDATPSGISVKRLEDRSSELRLLATGARLAADTDVREFSGRPRCRRNRHFEGERTSVRRFVELPFRWLLEVSLDSELAEPVRRICRDWPRRWLCFVVGRVGETLPALVRILAPSEPALSIGTALGLVLVPNAVSAIGDPGAEMELAWSGV